MLSVAAVAGTTTHTLIGLHDETFHPALFLIGMSVSAALLFTTLCLVDADRRRRDRIATTARRQRQIMLEREARRNAFLHNAEIREAIRKARAEDTTYRLPPSIIHSRVGDTPLSALRRDLLSSTGEIRLLE